MSLEALPNSGPDVRVPDPEVRLSDRPESDRLGVTQTLFAVGASVHGALGVGSMISSKSLPDLSGLDSLALAESASQRSSGLL